ncbi:hypothetical protein DERF_000338 [Dermatophagoides farinae]|uniref:Uncharacterized protein n=1 Tax=Dermatophagoides farinae TaxID=6954 RepID=A0A922I6D7_DERFA|nr:hypothetical protein DERF_000338 [Dermatophagoides farinae]
MMLLPLQLLVQPLIIKIVRLIHHHHHHEQKKSQMEMEMEIFIRISRTNLQTAIGSILEFPLCIV